MIAANSGYQVGVALIDVADGEVHEYGVKTKFVAASTGHEGAVRGHQDGAARCRGHRLNVDRHAGGVLPLGHLGRALQRFLGEDADPAREGAPGRARDIAVGAQYSLAKILHHVRVAGRDSPAPRPVSRRR